MITWFQLWMKWCLCVAGIVALGMIATTFGMGLALGLSLLWPGLPEVVYVVGGVFALFCLAGGALLAVQQAQYKAE